MRLEINSHPSPRTSLITDLLPSQNQTNMKDVGLNTPNNGQGSLSRLLMISQMTVVVDP